MLPAQEAIAVVEGLRKTLAGYSPSIQWRFLRGMSAMVSSLARDSWTSFQDSSTETRLWDWLRRHLGANETARGFLTAHDEWEVFRAGLIRLMSFGAIPTFALPPISKKADKLGKQVRTGLTVLDKLALSESARAALANPAGADDTFFETMDVATDALLREIKTSTSREIQQIADDFAYGQSLIAKCDIDRLRHLMKKGISIDIAVRGGSKNQPLSLFSPDHPSGLVNLVGWAYYENNSILYDRSWRGAGHADYYPGGIDGVRKYLGLTINLNRPGFPGGSLV